MKRRYCLEVPTFPVAVYARVTRTMILIETLEAARRSDYFRNP